MSKMTRRDFLEVTGAGLGSLALKDGSMLPAQPEEVSAALAALYQKFLDPDRKYSIRPFWFWNGNLTGEELERQIQPDGRAWRLRRLRPQSRRSADSLFVGRVVEGAGRGLAGRQGRRILSLHG